MSQRLTELSNVHPWGPDFYECTYPASWVSLPGPSTSTWPCVWGRLVSKSLSAVLIHFQIFNPQPPLPIVLIPQWHCFSDFVTSIHYPFYKRPCKFLKRPQHYLNHGTKVSVNSNEADDFIHTVTGAETDLSYTADVLLRKVHHLNLTMWKHSTSPNWGTFYQ